MLRGNWVAMYVLVQRFIPERNDTQEWQHEKEEVSQGE